MTSFLLSDLRAGPPAWFDMTGRFPPNGGGRWYGVNFRIGDKAVIRSVLSDWRDAHPDHRLTMITDPKNCECESAEIEVPWMMAGIADEVRRLDGRDTDAPPPDGERLYVRHLFNWWKDVRARGLKHRLVQFPPEVQQDGWALMNGKRLRSGEFVTLQPLCDAYYDTHRNAPLSWWAAVAKALSAEHRVAVLCPPKIGALWPPSGYDVILLCGKAAGVMGNLLVLSQAAAHFGGETGFTLWADVFGVPTAAAYRYWDPPWPKNAARGMDTRPGAGGAPVVHVPLGCDPGQAAAALTALVGADKGACRR